MTTKITEKNISSLANAGIQWQSVITADGSTTTTGVAGRGYFINTTNAAHTFTLPAIATFADTILIKDYAGTFATNKLTIARNGHNIQGAANNSEIDTNRASVTLVYVDVTRGWEFVTESNVADLGQALFITATGGTITTSGDFKIHSFTGDGCFVVATVGNSPTVPTGGPGNVDYLVVAGGGAGGSFRGGGGGAGGFRESRQNAPDYTASPLVAPAGLPVSVQTYPITVGGGGTGAPSSKGTSGSNSIFSTITSTGGGGGGAGVGVGSPIGPGSPGGSGGGAGNEDGITAHSIGTGNTPPTSPSQGNNGGLGAATPQVGFTGAGGGGGGAGSVGGNAPGNLTAGSGGNGVATSITGSPVTRSGGGGAGVISGPTPAGPKAGTAGTGGPGGGGNGSGTTNGSAGTANTGGGGGGGGGNSDNCYSSSGGSGGTGIVIIRYKFQ